MHASRRSRRLARSRRGNNHAAQMPRVTVNGAELYYEIRGTGPPLLLIMGATGDGGHFDELADLLADEFTVDHL